MENLKINYKWNEQQLEELHEILKKASEINMAAQRLSWLFEVESKEETEFLNIARKAEGIEIFIEKQLPL